jgi:predicted RNA methylase
MSTTTQQTPSDESITEKAFTPYDIQACLYDEPRIGLYKQAIFDIVKPGDVVVDGASGSGILGLLAAQAGASKVYCVELNMEYTEVIKQNAKNNGFEDKFVVIHADVTKVDLPEQVDVIACDLISGGFFYEPQIQAINNLKRFLKPGGRITPLKLDNYVELINAEDELYGLKLSYDTRYHAFAGDAALTSRAKYHSADFNQDVPSAVNASVTLRCMASGTANAIRVWYDMQFSDGILSTTPTPSVLNPQVMFLKKPVSLLADRYYTVSLAYEAGASPLTCRIVIEPWPAG